MVYVNGFVILVGVVIYFLLQVFVILSCPFFSNVLQHSPRIVSHHIHVKIRHLINILTGYDVVCYKFRNKNETSIHIEN